MGPCKAGEGFPSAERRWFAYGRITTSHQGEGALEPARCTEEASGDVAAVDLAAIPLAAAGRAQAKAPWSVGLQLG